MHTLLDLSYDYDALEPYIDARTMEIHHGKHHQGYVDKLNQALEGYPELKSKSVIHLISNLDKVPEEIRTAVQNNGGGDANHSLFFNLLSREGSDQPTGALAEAIDRCFGGFKPFQEEFTKAAKERFGSGWAWLSLNPEGTLLVESTPNQDNPWMLGRAPILGLDVWEHAYYLHYQNRRPDYIDAWWNIVNWELVGKNFESQISNSAPVET